jgi:molybdopterin-guanine dinucleotide biosynthesis protein MobB
MRVYGVTGWENTGKTHLMARLVAASIGRGISVSTVKHAHHDTEVDHPGTDRHRHRLAVARAVALVSPRRWAVTAALRGAPEPALAAVLARLSPVDLVLVDGYKTAPNRRVEEWRAAAGRLLLAPGSPTVQAIAADGPVAAGGLPVYALDDTAGIADFVLREVGL